MFRAGQSTRNKTLWHYCPQEGIRLHRGMLYGKGGPMPFQTFMAESGFKVLAMARLGSCEYSICLYLLNCAVSNMHELITTEKEFASLIGAEDDVLQAAMQSLV